LTARTNHHVGARASRNLRLGSHYSFVDPEESRFLTPGLIELERQGLSQIMLYPPLNRQYRVIEDFADRVMARL
jgi:hypothetical protein